jgi:hypothetical protein
MCVSRGFVLVSMIMRMPGRVFVRVTGAAGLAMSVRMHLPLLYPLRPGPEPTLRR